MLSEQKEELTPLQHKLNKVGNAIGILALAVCVVVFVLEMIALKWDWSQFSEAFITAVALAVAAIPEGLATVVTIVLSIPTIVSGMWGMNVKGLPFADNPFGFWIVLGITGLIAFTSWFLLKKKDMF